MASVTFSTGIRNIRGAATVAAIDNGSVNATGKIEFYSGTRPSSPQVEPVGVTLLCALNFSNPAYGPHINGRASANPISGGANNILATGMCTWFRVFDRDNNPLWDGNVSIPGRGGDIQLADTYLIRGKTFQLEQLDAVEPA